MPVWERWRAAAQQGTPPTLQLPAAARICCPPSSAREVFSHAQPAGDPAPPVPCSIKEGCRLAGQCNWIQYPLAARPGLLGPASLLKP